MSAWRLDYRAKSRKCRSSASNAMDDELSRAGFQRLLLFRAGGRSRRVHGRRPDAANSEIDTEPSHSAARGEPWGPAAQSHLTAVRNDRRGRGLLSPRGGDVA